MAGRLDGVGWPHPAPNMGVVLSKIIYGTVAFLLLLFVDAAFAQTNTLSGKLKGEPASAITLKVQLNKKGEPARVSGIKVTNATYVCTDRTSGTISKNLSGSAKVTKSGSGKQTSWVFNMQFNPATQTSFSGELNRKGTRVTGGVSYSFVKDAETENICEFAKGFTAKK